MDHDDDCAYCASGEAYEHTYEPPATNMADLTDPSTLLDTIAERFAEDADAHPDSVLLAHLFAYVMRATVVPAAELPAPVLVSRALDIIDSGTFLPD